MMSLKTQWIPLFVLFTFSACMTDEGCRRAMEGYGSDDVLVVLHEKPKKRTDYYNVTGKDLISGQDTTIHMKGRWYENLDYVWDVGDTVIKNKGELIITIKKPDGTVRYSEWTCEGVYLDGKSVSTGLPKKKN